MLRHGRDPARPLLARLGEDQHRPPRGGGRRRRADQGGAGAAARRRSRRTCTSATPNPHIALDGIAVLRCRPSRRRGRRRRAARRGRQLVRLQRHQRARHPRRGAERRRGAPRADDAAGAARCWPSRPRAGRCAESPSARAAAAGADEPRLADVCFTANAGRAHFGHRLAVGGAHRPSCARARLTTASTGCPAAPAPGRGRRRTPRSPSCSPGRARSTPAWAGGLYETQPVFRRAARPLRRAARRCWTGPCCPCSTRATSASGADRRDRPTRSRRCSPSSTRSRELWRSWGVEPAAVLGHSRRVRRGLRRRHVLLEDGLALIAERGRLMQSLARPARWRPRWRPDPPAYGNATRGRRGLQLDLGRQGPDPEPADRLYPQPRSWGPAA